MRAEYTIVYIQDCYAVQYYNMYIYLQFKNINNIKAGVNKPLDKTI